MESRRGAGFEVDERGRAGKVSRVREYLSNGGMLLPRENGLGAAGFMASRAGY
jgi:hypothetical protein